jgi:zinc transporter
MSHAMPSPPATAQTYGADAHGLICGYLFLPGEAPRPIPTAVECGTLLKPPAGGFLWLHFHLGHSAAQSWMRANLGLGESFYEALDQGSSRSTRIERDGEQLFAVVNDVTFDFSFDPGDVATLWVSVGRELVVTGRLHPLRAVDRLRTAVNHGESLASSVALLDHLLNDQADELQRIVRRAADRLDDIEDALLAGHHERHTPELGRLRRLMVRLQRLLAPEPSALMRTLANPPAWVGSEDRAHLHRASEEFALVLRDVAALQERIKLLQDEAAAHVAEENNRSVFVLTMVTVLALPINLVSGMFGMNVGGIPLAGNTAGFWIMVAIIASLTGVIAWLALRRVRMR